MAPAATPRSVVDKLATELERAMQSAELKQAFNGISVEVDYRRSEDFNRYLKMISGRFSEVIRKGNIKVD
jgi:tripartite-type tricarboxylate transporter receptor subunit TctC